MLQITRTLSLVSRPDWIRKQSRHISCHPILWLQFLGAHWSGDAARHGLEIDEWTHLLIATNSTPDLYHV